VGPLRAEKLHVDDTLFRDEVYRPQDDGQQAAGSVIRDITCIARNQLPTIVHPCEAPVHFLAVAVMWDGSNGSPAPPLSNQGFNHSLGIDGSHTSAHAIG